MGIYVFLPSGNVLVSDMKSGTFIFRVDPIAPPGASSGLSATPGDTQIGLTWAAASGAATSRLRRPPSRRQASPTRPRTEPGRKAA